ncbi:unnamed protein product [Rotaria sp. Silwood1]|nr:unnamed protein product [Rotaria sp. Silwood1]CAF4862126.1 unnamed protein product [Rotaria sp. Silwood1]
MASARNLGQHSDMDDNECTSNDYILCPHSQLQLCLKHLNYHQDLLRQDLYYLSDKYKSSFIEFDTYKTEQDKPLKNNLIKHFKKVLKQKQINIDDLNEMKNKLYDIERGVEELD